MNIDGFSARLGMVSSRVQKAIRDEGGEAPGRAALEMSESYEPTGDVTGLLNALDQVPLLRQDIVAKVAARLSTGELNTRVASEQTVKAIVGTTLSDV